MPRMRVIATHTWRQGTVKPGDIYEATDDEAKLLVALEWSEVIGLDAPQEETPPKRGRGYARRDMAPETRDMEPD